MKFTAATVALMLTMEWTHQIPIVQKCIAGLGEVRFLLGVHSSTKKLREMIVNV
jgi:hypothetical protein